MLFRSLRIPLLRYALSFGLPVEDGKDIVRKAFLSLFRHLAQEKSRTNLRAWLFRVTHNLALKRRQRRQRNSEAASDHFELLLKEPGLNPEERRAWSQQQANVWALVQSLPERDRCCLSLRAEGLQYSEIAETAGMSFGAVALSLSRSVVKLSQFVEQQR